MSVSITLNDVSNLQNWLTAGSTIDGNSASIETAFGSCLNTAGDTMTGNLDMNGYSILNQGVSANTNTYTVATLPTPTLGLTAIVTDGTSGLAWGATVTGGFSTSYLVWYNGAAWTVLGK